MTEVLLIWCSRDSGWGVGHETLGLLFVSSARIEIVYDVIGQVGICLARVNEIRSDIP
jgi:hypothetical protein